VPYCYYRLNTAPIARDFKPQFAFSFPGQSASCFLLLAYTLQQSQQLLVHGLFDLPPRA